VSLLLVLLCRHTHTTTAMSQVATHVDIIGISDPIHEVQRSRT
jgi:hypothetical protein